MDIHPEFDPRFRQALTGAWMYARAFTQDEVGTAHEAAIVVVLRQRERPKNRKPFHLVPVISLAIVLSDPDFLSQ